MYLFVAPHERTDAHAAEFPLQAPSQLPPLTPRPRHITHNTHTYIYIYIYIKPTGASPRSVCRSLGVLFKSHARIFCGNKSRERLSRHNSIERLRQGPARCSARNLIKISTATIPYLMCLTETPMSIISISNPNNCLNSYIIVTFK